MSNEEAKELYDSNPEFKEYIDKCRKQRGLSVEEELSFITPKLYGEWLVEDRKGREFEKYED